MLTRRILENFFSLFTLQVFNYILPFLTLPYLARVLSVERFGLIFFAMAFMQYFNVLVDYGFTITTTKDVSINRNSKEELSRIFTSVYIIKTVLLILSFIVLLIVVFSSEKFRHDYPVYLLSFGIVIGQFLFPVWFFQGIEQMKYITLINVLSKVIFTALVFIFVKSDSDFLFVPAFNSLGYILGGILSIYIIFKKFNIKFDFDINHLKKTFKEGFFIFFSISSSSLIYTSPSFLIGLFLGNQQVAYYISAEKVINAIKSILGVINQSFYPHLSLIYKENFSLYLKKWQFLLKIILLSSTFFILILMFFSKEITFILYGKNFFETVSIIKLLSLTIFTYGIINMLGLQRLVIMGRNKEVAFSQFFPGIAFILLSVFVLYFFKSYFAVIYLLIFTDILIILIRIFYIKRE